MFDFVFGELDIVIWMKCDGDLPRHQGHLPPLLQAKCPNSLFEMSTVGLVVLAARIESSFLWVLNLFFPTKKNNY